LRTTALPAGAFYSAWWDSLIHIARRAGFDPLAHFQQLGWEEDDSVRVGSFNRFT
jgi:hypothetical protein